MSGGFFRVKKPCKDCPFRKDSLDRWLGKDRAQEIADSLERHSFPCHKTVKYGTKKPLKDTSYCAGAVLIQIKDIESGGQLGDLLQIGERLGLFDRNTYSGGELIFDSFAEFVKHHT